MSEPLARIALEVDGVRGPDVLCDVVVPAQWFTLGHRIQIELPERLACAACEGGGCDTCGRSGALPVPTSETPLELTLPRASESAGAVRVRLPGWGALASDPESAPEHPRGHLILSVRVGEQPSRGVRVISGAPIKATTADVAFAWRIVLMVVTVSLLFVFLLRFSGWM